MELTSREKAIAATARMLGYKYSTVTDIWNGLVIDPKGYPVHVMVRGKFKYTTHLYELGEHLKIMHKIVIK